MPKANNMYGVAYKPIHKIRNQHKHGNDPVPKSPIRSGLVNFLAFSEVCKPKLATISQIFVCLAILLVSANVWAAPTVDLTVIDTKGNDSVFNGEANGEQLRITVLVTDDEGDAGKYYYKVTVDNEDITINPPNDAGAFTTINKDQTKIVQRNWDGAGLLDGTYTIRAEIFDNEKADGEPLDYDTESVTLDTTAPDISIGTDVDEFSPNRDRVLDSIDVFYSISEDVTKSTLEFYLKTGDEEGDRVRYGSVSLQKRDGDYTYIWGGGDRNRTFPDGEYILSFTVIDKAGNKGTDETNPITIDTVAPTISQTVANEDLTLLDGGFINVPIQSIKVTVDAGDGTPLDFTASETEITVKKQGGATINGGLSSEEASLTFSFGNRLDAASENGKYTASIAIADRAGNAAERTLDFIFDNVAPNLREVATSEGELTPGSGVSTWMNFVEATLRDNLEDGLSLSDSTIRLTGPNGAVLGRQTQPAANRIRWFLLSPLLARDGLMDGEYTIEIVAIDKAGNQTGVLQIPFIYDNLAPLVTLGFDETSPFTLNQDTIYHAQPLSQIVATFDDAGVGVNLRQDTRIVFGTRHPGGGVNTLPGRVVRATDGGQLTYVLETPLTSRDGSQDGRYALNVQATDTLGNTKTYNYHFVYDTQLPALASTVPAANETVSELSQVEVVLDEATSGIDFIQSTFQLTRNVDGNAVDVPVNITSNGTDAATLTLAKPIALDGSDDGTYTIEISPTDLAGNVGVTVQREFYLVSQSRPEIRLAMPETTTVNDLTTVAAELSGYIGAGIDFDASTLTVRDAQSRLVAQTELEHDEVNNLLTWNIETPLPRDGSADGEYTITATFVDFIGRRLTQQFQLLLDTQFPAIESVQVATDSQSELSTDSTTTVAEGFSQIVVTFENAQEGFVSGIDFINTNVTLTNSTGESISVNQSDDGQSVLTLDFQALTQLGEYVLSITPQDLAGNQSTAPFVYRVRIDVPLPTVSSVLISGKLGTIVYVNGDSTNIVATFADLSGAGLDLDDGGSTITVTNESGLPAPGITTSNGTDQLTWSPIVLPTDGSADGRYTVTVTPKDKSGRQGDVVYRQFVFDTQEPRITAATPVSLSQPATYIGGTLTQLQFTVEDVGPAGLELEEQTVELLGLQGTPIAAALTLDEINSQLYLTLDTPLAQDGSADGEYTVKVSLVDKAGNILDSEQTFVYDSQVPRLASVSVNTESPMELVPQEITEISESISSITLQFEEATRVDFTNTVVDLVGPDGQPISLNISADGLTQLTARFVELTQAGLYTLSVTPQDIAGNVAQGAVQYSFRLVFVLPSVSSVELGGQTGDVVFLNGSDSTIVATLVDGTGTGLDLGEGGSSIVVTSPTGAVVSGQTRSDGANQLIWEPISLPTDGSADGRYTVAVTPVDKAGRQGDVVYRQFIYDTQEPRVTASNPVSLNQPATYIGGTLTQLQFTVEDVGPAGLELEEQTVELLGLQGTPIAAALTLDEINSYLYLTLDTPLAQDGSADGEYTVKVSLVDKAGNILDSEQTFVYDSQVPRLASVSVNTESAMELVPQEITEISESISSITLQFEEATRVDFTNTVVDLVGPDGQPISLNISADGLTQLTARFVELTQAGLYTLSVTPQDIAGNVAQGAVQYSFRLVFVLPSVSSVELGGQTGDVVFLNGSDSTIVATLVDGTGTGLDLGEGGSSIVVTSPAGAVVSGQTRSDGANQLIWEPISLPTDGSADGRYTVAVTPVDKAGRQGDVVYRQFIYDTENPRITASSPIVLSQPVSYISGLNQFTFAVEDVGPADLLLESQTIELIDSSGSAVPATLTYDELTNQLYLTLSSPFARDGSVDGAYTVKLSLIDRAGNTLDLEHLLIYDSQVPQLSSVIVDTEAPLELLPEQVGEVSESISSITLQFEEATKVDFANTAITLVGPNEASIPLTLEDDGISQLTASFLNLRQVGIYTLSVTPQDVAGNVATGAINYRFVLSLGLPSVSSLVIGGKSEDVVFINGSDTTIIATLMDATGIGLVLGEGGSSIVVTGPSGAVVSGQTRSDGANQLIWEPISLPTDGSADGRYTVAITPINKTGRQGDVVHRQFIYDTENPRITASSPIVLSQPVSYISRGLNQFIFTVEDVGPADLLLESQTIELIDSSGSAVPATLTYDELTNQLYLTLSSPFARDGSVDGAYTVKLSLIDRAGNTLDLEHSLIYDSQVPRLSSVIVDTESPLELLPEQVGEVSESISSITLQFEEATKVDFANTAITLVGPNEASIPLTLEDDGISRLTASFLNLRQVGIYTLSVTPQDVAGNVATGAINYRFVLSLGLPSVSSLVIGGKSEDVVFINGSDTTIIATLMDATGIGLVLGEGGSSIVVTGPSGAVVPGQTSTDGTNQLIWEPISLPTDGSADGRYTVAITPIDKTGRQGDVVYRQFIYDTENPRITASSPIVLSQPVSYISGLNQFVFTVEDVGPADLLLEAQTIELIDSSGSAVPAILTSDELTNQLYLTLSSPFARDGSVDGAYTVKLSLIDRAGNTLGLEHLLIYDSQVPQLSSVMVNTEVPVELVPQEVAEILEPISSITLQFDEATRVDFANTVITLVNSDATDASGELTAVEIPLTLKDDGISQMTVSFLELNQIGTYVLSIRPQDIAGNVATGAFNYTFILDIPLPSVSSIIIGDAETVAGGDIAYVNANNMIIGAELLDPTETGLSFGSDGSDITVVDASNTIVAGAIGSNGVNLLLWQPITLTTDGTTDGRYSVYVFPVDKAGRQGSTAYREFIYDTQEPEIIGANPIDLSQPVSYISQSLTQFHFTVADVGPAELELSDQKVSLRDASGNLVPAQLTNDTNSQLFLTLDQPLPLDGSMDGEYTVAVELTDKAGNAFTVEHRIVYDTQAPTLVSTVPADGSLLTEDVTQIQVTLNDEGGSGIDWTTTMVTLVNPSGQQISGELVSNGTTTLTLSTNQLVEDGRYIIRVRAVDRAGNGNATLFERNFLLSRRLPTIVSTEPVTAPEDEAFTNEEIEQIEVELETDDENHLSTLRLLNPDNQVVAGQQQRASGRLIYNLVRPLATDGSADGIYTIEFTPISASGRSGEIQRLTFTYDTQAPEIESDDVINFVVAQPGVNNSLIEISVNLTDDTSGIDWENLDEEWLTFERRSPNPAKISGRVSDDGQSTLTFRLTVPLADNGSADGEYRITVTPKDRAGNDDEPYEKVFIYDTSPPMVDAGTLLINDAPLLVDINADNYPTAVSSRGGVVIQANIFDTGLGVNLAQSKIIVRRPDGSEVSGNTQQNGVDTIVFKSDGLSFQGSYQVTVMSVGNDSELLGFAPTDSITTEFLYETGEPTATVTSDGGETELTDEPLPLEGTTSDPAGTQRIGEGEIPVPASGVWLVEIVGTGPDKQPIDPVPAVDDSNAQEEPWNRWSIDFLPTRSGEYDLDVRVTDNAGNYAVYDVGTYTMSVSLTFRGSTFGWPNPLRLSQRDVAFFSFDVNVPLGETIELTLSIYDWSGDMVLSQTYPDVVSGQRNDQLVKWNLENQAGTPVARGLYIFRLEAVNAAGNRANTVGKVLVVD